MPKQSEKAKLSIEVENVLKFMIICGKKDSEEFKIIAKLYVGINSARYLKDIIPVPKSRGLRELLWTFDEFNFKQVTRMKKQTFLKLLGMIENNSVFQNKSAYFQGEIWHQLYVALNRFGCFGNGASNGALARTSGIGFGTVTLYTKRVMEALKCLEKKVIFWPDYAERARISKRFGNLFGIPGTVGVLDGTLINLSQRPAIDGEVYFTRKGRYSLNVQLICDDRKLIRYHIIGYPGSMFDQTIFSLSKLGSNAASYMSNGQYLIADAGYALSNHVCTPYKQPAASVPHNQQFNILLSKARVLIEHVNGILKGRWMSLRGINRQIRELSDFQFVNEWILCCLILHNLTTILDDDWDDAYNDEDTLLENYYMGPTNETENLRLRVQNYLLQWYYCNN